MTDPDFTPEDGWVRVGKVTDLQDRLGLPDGGAAWEAIVSRDDIEVNHADGDDKPWVVWMREDRR